MTSRSNLHSLASKDAGSSLQLEAHDVANVAALLVFLRLIFEDGCQFVQDGQDPLELGVSTSGQQQVKVPSDAACSPSPQLLRAQGWDVGAREGSGLSVLSLLTRCREVVEVLGTPNGAGLLLLLMVWLASQRRSEPCLLHK